MDILLLFHFYVYNMEDFLEQKRDWFTVKSLMALNVTEQYMVGINRISEKYALKYLLYIAWT